MCFRLQTLVYIKTLQSNSFYRSYWWCIDQNLQ